MKLEGLNIEMTFEAENVEESLKILDIACQYIALEDSIESFDISYGGENGTLLVILNAVDFADDILFNKATSKENLENYITNTIARMLALIDISVVGGADTLRVIMEESIS